MRQLDEPFPGLNDLKTGGFDTDQAVAILGAAKTAIHAHVSDPHSGFATKSELQDEIRKLREEVGSFRKVLYWLVGIATAVISAVITFAPTVHSWLAKVPS